MQPTSFLSVTHTYICPERQFSSRLVIQSFGKHLDLALLKSINAAFNLSIKYVGAHFGRILKAVPAPSCRNCLSLQTVATGLHRLAFAYLYLQGLKLEN